MAYKKKTNRKKRGGKSWYNQKYSALQLAQKALKSIHYIRGMINCEKHYHDVQSSVGASQDYNGTITLLSGMAQGDDVGNRSGNSVLARSLYFQCDTLANGSSVSNLIRVIIFQDQENTGTAPTVADVLAVTGSGMIIESPLNVDHLARYKILVDKKLQMSNNGMNQLNYKRYIKLYSHLKYTGSAATDVYKNNIYVLTCASVNANTPTMTWYSRLGFYDN